MNILYEQMTTEKKNVNSQIREVTALLKKFPDGKLICARNGKYYKWYLTDGKNKVYLPKEKRALASKLAAKKYYSLLLEDLQQEKRAIEFYLRHCNPNGRRSEQLLLNTPEYQELLTKDFKPLSQELREWASSPYDKNPKYPEQLNIKTSFGGSVRSKSEAMIDMYLHTHLIPFRYEASLTLGDTIFYPDFTIRHPETGKIYYWEHFGLVDDPAYRQNMISKLNLYTSHGIIPTIQLITTYETKEKPLSSDLVEKIIRHYFL